MFNSYHDFEISIQPPNGDVFPYFIQAPGGEARGELCLPTDTSIYQELEQRLGQLDTDEEALLQLGTLLFEALFQGKSGEVLSISQGRMQAGEGLRFKLSIAAEERVVAALPWEFIADPVRGPLALLDMPIVRYLPLALPTSTLKTTLPLKVLLTGAHTPPNPAAVTSELRAVQETLESVTQRGLVQVDVEEHLTPRTLQALLRQDFHIWHFVGHGGFDQTGRNARLSLEDDDGDVQRVSAMQLGIMLNRSSLRLVVLNACESARLSVEPFRSLAPALIRGQVPAVVAMQFSVPQESTRAFAAEFYRTLAEGFPIDACVTEGRKAIMNEIGLGRPDWGIPVVYTRATDGKLFETPTPPPSESNAARGSGGVSINIQNSQLDHSSMTVSEVGNIVKGNSTSDVNSDVDNEELDKEIAALKTQISLKKRRLRALQNQQAIYGISTDPSILIQIEDLEKEIIQLREELCDLSA
ncbi:MAG: CHAT domain-containing protein [Chloroflexi bacterium AL-W]|nr:CHAT domain-containing protein [Chloroflexi bacterium AL-N1]NOK66195.1 CHAT domain-containing protein [Chloroflexi bacterium AL-N10]NOK73076.1 CHAT domain-containing protein [Chloroflexi bacterium AL-N5]NOK79973.1 CHAT domain-containing protein [Chloroflexi bacterium AL-W]NOK88171.1 CHAT domain-containing protein [Chloroflexi bacterium AL-N15]